MAKYTTPSRREVGMSLTEAMVSLLLLTMMMIAFLGLVDSSAKVSKVQNNIADSTESVRFAMAAMVRMTRMAGTGGVPLVFDGKDTDGNPDIKPLAVTFFDNTEPEMAAGSLVGSREVWGDSDLLRIRGAIVSDLWDLDGELHVDFSGNKLTIPAQSPVPGVTDLQDLTNFPNDPEKRSIIMVMNHDSPSNPVVGAYVRRFNDYRIVQVPDGGTVDDSDSNELLIDFTTVDDNTPESPIKNNPTGAWVEPNPKSAIVHAGFMEQTEFFIGKNESGLPSLYRFMGTGTADEMIPNIVDLQVAFGCDINMDGDLAADEWYMSGANSTKPGGNELFFLREVRISVVSRSQSPDPKWTDTVTAPENGTLVYDPDHRHRVLTVRVKLRAQPAPGV